MAQVAAISQQIWDMKYRLKAPGGGAIDKTIEDSWRRVATALASVEKDPALWADRFYDALRDFRFLPAGRILACRTASRAARLIRLTLAGIGRRA